MGSLILIIKKALKEQKTQGHTFSPERALSELRSYDFASSGLSIREFAIIFTGLYPALLTIALSGLTVVFYERGKM